MRLASADRLDRHRPAGRAARHPATGDGGISIGALTTYRGGPRVAGGDGVRLILAEAHPGHRRRPGPQPRHDRRLDRARRPGVGPAGRASSPSTRRSSLRSTAGRAAVAADGLLPGRLPDRRSPTDEILTEIRSRRRRRRRSDRPTPSSSSPPRATRSSVSRRSCGWQGAAIVGGAASAITGVGDVAYRARAVEAALIGVGRLGGSDRGRGGARDRWPDGRLGHPRRSRLPRRDGRRSTRGGRSRRRWRVLRLTADAVAGECDLERARRRAVPCRAHVSVGAVLPRDLPGRRRTLVEGPAAVGRRPRRARRRPTAAALEERRRGPRPGAGRRSTRTRPPSASPRRSPVRD